MLITFKWRITHDAFSCCLSSVIFQFRLGLFMFLLFSYSNFVDRCWINFNSFFVIRYSLLFYIVFRSFSVSKCSTQMHPETRYYNFNSTSKYESLIANALSAYILINARSHTLALRVWISSTGGPSLLHRINSRSTQLSNDLTQFFVVVSWAIVSVNASIFSKLNLCFTFR